MPSFAKDLPYANLLENNACELERKSKSIWRGGVGLRKYVAWKKEKKMQICDTGKESRTGVYPPPRRQ